MANRRINKIGELLFVSSLYTKNESPSAPLLNIRSYIETVDPFYDGLFGYCIVGVGCIVKR